MCGVNCFTRRVHKTRVPSNFKLPDHFKKFDGLQDPEDWLVDYLETVKLLEGNRATAMQSIQLHLSGVARSWLKKLPEESIDNWEAFERVFIQNFKATCKRPASIEELRTCVQIQASLCDHISSVEASSRTHQNTYPMKGRSTPLPMDSAEETWSKNWAGRTRRQLLN